MSVSQSGKQPFAFLQAHDIDTNVYDPYVNRTAPGVDFESCKCQTKNGDLEQSQFAVHCLILNVTMLSVLGCVLNVADETC